MFGRLIEYFGFIGGSAGVFYATGYLVLAGHSRVLGLPLRATDTSTLLNNAFEFILQGALYSVLRSLQEVMRYATQAVLMVTLGRNCGRLDLVARIESSQKCVATDVAPYVATSIDMDNPGGAAGAVVAGLPNHLSRFAPRHRSPRFCPRQSRRIRPFQRSVPRCARFFSAPGRKCIAPSPAMASRAMRRR